MGAMNADLRLLQFTDTHLAADDGFALRGVATRPALQAVLAHARAFHWKSTDALLLTGDLVHDDAGGYGAVREEFGRLGKPVYCVPGNHDEATRLAQELAADPFRVGGHHDSGAWRIVLLDSAVPGEAGGRLADAELERLQAALASAGGRHVLVCLHHHPVPMGSRWLDTVPLANPQALFALTDAFPEVRAILWGHVHQAFESRRRGVRLFGTPSTCAQFLPGAEQFAIDAAPPGYRRLCLHPDGTIDTEVLRVPLPAHVLEEPTVIARALG